jgi:hypothetical protein
MGKTAREIGIFLLFLLLVLNAFTEGFRMPSLWTQNYYLPTFFDGFYRRSMAGTLLFFLGDLKYNYYILASIQFLVLVLLIGWMYYAFRSSLIGMFLVTAFMVSINGSFFFHEVGYIEQLLFVLLFVSIALYRNFPIVAILLMAISMFVHEIVLLTTLPIFFSYVYFKTKDLSKAFKASLPALVAFGVIYMYFQTLPFDEVRSFMEYVRTHANYPYRYDYYEVFVNNFIGERFQNYYHINSLLPLFLLIFVTIVTGYVLYHTGATRI